MSLFNELKRRNVFKVAAAYAVVGWLLLQISATITPLMNAPDWVPTVVLIFLLIGYPLALFFAWAYELTPEGLKREREVDRDTSITHETGRKIDFIIIGALIIALGYFVWESRFAVSPRMAPIQTAQAGERNSIAVLPFVNMSSDQNNTYFSDGISEEILNVLAQVPDLKVTSRSSAFQFRGSEVHIPTVAKQLGVSNVLEGSVRKSGTRVRITAQLIDAENDQHLWSETYDRELNDIFAVQDEISAAIVTELKNKLGIEVRAAPKVLVAATPEAHEAFLRGRYLMEQRKPATLNEAVSEFKKAIVADPDYAKAYAGLAVAISLQTQGQYGDYTDKEAVDLSLPYAEKALSLAPNLPEAILAKAFVQWGVVDIQQTIADLERVLQLNPNDSYAMNLLGNLYTDDLAEYEKGHDYTMQALRLNPLSIPALGNTTSYYINRREYEKAAPLIDKMKTLSMPFHGLLLTWKQQEEGQHEEALLTAMKTMEYAPNFGRIRNVIVRAFFNIGLIEEAKALLPESQIGWYNYEVGRYQENVEISYKRYLQDPENESYQRQYYQAKAATGDYKDFLAILEKSFADHKGLIANGAFQQGDLNDLMHYRLMDNPDADLSDVFVSMKANLKKLEKLKFRSFDQTMLKRHMAYYMGDYDEAMKLLRRQIFEYGYRLDNRNGFLDKLTTHPLYAETVKLQADRFAAWRFNFLTLVCRNSPYAAYWQPEKATCDQFLSDGD